MEQPISVALATVLRGRALTAVVALLAVLFATEAHVTEINVDANGRVTGVSYLKGGVEYFQPASVVLLAAYTYENVRTLLLSK